MVSLMKSAIEIDIRSIWGFASPLPGVEPNGFWSTLQLLVYIIGEELVFGLLLTDRFGRTRS